MSTMLCFSVSHHLLPPPVPSPPFCGLLLWLAMASGHTLTQWGYNNIRIKEGHQERAAFITPQGLFEPLVMTFGLCNAPATFQAMMDNIFADLIAQGLVFVYIDDIIIATHDLDQHQQITHKVLHRLEIHNLFINLDKCLFEESSVEFLGTIIGYNKIQMTQEKVQAVLDWPTPKIVKEVQKFRGFANYYQQFIKGFSEITKPLDLVMGKEGWH